MRMVTSSLHRRSSHPLGDLILRVMGEETIMGEVKSLEEVDIIPRNLSLMSQSQSDGEVNRSFYGHPSVASFVWPQLTFLL